MDDAKRRVLCSQIQPDGQTVSGKENTTMVSVDDTDRPVGLQEAAAAVSARVKVVALLYGGTNGEREVSIAGGIGVQTALEEEGFKVVPIDTGKPGFIDRLREAKPDVAFIVLHGKGGEDGCIQGFLETLDIPYTHSGVCASALAMDKPASKIMYQAAGLHTAAFEVVWRNRLDIGDAVSPDIAPITPSSASSSVASTIDSILATTGLPCVVKPPCDGSSLGVSIVRTREEFLHVLDEGFKTGESLLVEEFITGVEVTVPVLGNTVEELFALPVIEIVPKNEFYDYESKYTEGGSEHIIPARIAEELRAVCQQVAIDAHRILGCAGVSRTDLIVTEDGVPYLIETNTIPGMTGTSLVPDAAQNAGIPPGMLCRLLIHYALEAQEAREA